MSNGLDSTTHAAMALVALSRDVCVDDAEIFRRRETAAAVERAKALRQEEREALRQSRVRSEIESIAGVPFVELVPDAEPLDDDLESRVVRVFYLSYAPHFASGRDAVDTLRAFTTFPNLYFFMPFFLGHEQGRTLDVQTVLERMEMLVPPVNNKKQRTRESRRSPGAVLNEDCIKGVFDFCGPVSARVLGQTSRAFGAAYVGKAVMIARRALRAAVRERRELWRVPELTSRKATWADCMPLVARGRTHQVVEYLGRQCHRLMKSSGDHEDPDEGVGFEVVFLDPHLVKLMALHCASTVLSPGDEVYTKLRGMTVDDDVDDFFRVGGGTIVGLVRTIYFRDGDYGLLHGLL